MSEIVLSAQPAKLEFLRPTRDRIVIIQEKDEERMVGGLIMPQSPKRSFHVARIHAMGPRAEGFGYAVGDMIVFQVNPQFLRSITHKVGEHMVVILHTGDVIGKLTKGLTLSRDAFEPCGRWVLTKLDLISMFDGIILPDSSQLTAANSRFFVEQTGPKVTVALDELSLPSDALKVGTEIYPDMSRLTPISFEGCHDRFGFIDPTYVFGYIS